MIETMAMTKKRPADFFDDMEPKRACVAVFMGDGMGGFEDVEASFPQANHQMSADLSRCESGASFSSRSSTTEECLKGAQTSTSSDHSSPVNDDCVKKKKHNLVEQNRRETTRAMIADLKDMVGADGGTAAHPNINKVLEGTLQYLKRNLPLVTRQSKPEAEKLRVEMGSPLQANIGRYLSGFSAAPFGIICAKPNGCITRVNDQVERMFGLPAGFAKGKIMFSLTAEHHMPMAMGVANKLLAGETDQEQIVKDCVGSSGKPFPYLCQFHCIRKDNEAVGLVVYIRPNGHSPNNF